MNENTVRSNSTVLPSIRLTVAPTIQRCESGWNWRPKPFADSVFWLVLEGEGTLQNEAREIALFAGSSFLFAPGSQPSATQNDAHRLRVFSFTFSSEAPSKELQTLKTRDGAWFEMMAMRAVAAWNCVEETEENNREAARNLAAAMIAQWNIERAQPWPSPRMKDVVEIAQEIREAPGERWLVSDLCARAGLSPTQFTRRFTEHSGASPAHFVVTTRIERAKKLLRETEMPVAAISQSLGYHDVHFFCRQFKLFTGTTPGSLRK